MRETERARAILGIASRQLCSICICSVLCLIYSGVVCGRARRLFGY